MLTALVCHMGCVSSRAGLIGSWGCSWFLSPKSLGSVEKGPMRPDGVSDGRYCWPGGVEDGLNIVLREIHGSCWGNTTSELE